MITFQPIASSSAGNAYLVKAPGVSPLLLDAGVKFSRIQQAIGFTATGLSGCLVTHGHGDHCEAVPDLLKACVNVYASRGTWSSPFLKSSQSHHRANKIAAMMGFNVGPWRVMPFDVRHDADETLGFLVGLGDDLLMFLTDTAFVDYKFPGLTHICVEANWGEEELRANSRSGRIDGSRVKRVATSHMSIERVERLLDANDLTKVREIHLLHLSDSNSNAASFKERIQRKTGKLVFIAAKNAQTEVPHV